MRLSSLTRLASGSLICDMLRTILAISARASMTNNSATDWCMLLDPYNSRQLNTYECAAKVLLKQELSARRSRQTLEAKCPHAK
jgi:hypothetical protein